MQEGELQRVEAELRVTLPDDYRRLLLDFPFRPVTGDWIYWLYNAPDAVIQATREPLNGYYEGSAWLPTHIAIGETAMGDQYVIDTARTPSPVYCLSHETHEFEEEFADLTHFVNYWIQETTAMIQEAERPRPKRWWQLW